MEPQLRNSEGNLCKPDVVFVKGDFAVIVDVTIHWEDNSDGLERAHREKVDYYSSELEEDIKKISGNINVHFFGLVIGTRDKWNEGNNDLLKLLGTERDKNFKENLCRLVLYATANMMAMFSDEERSRIPIPCILLLFIFLLFLHILMSMNYWLTIPLYPLATYSPVLYYIVVLIYE